MDSANLQPAHILGILEGESQYTFAGLSRDKLDTLDNTVDYNMLNARILSFGVLSDKNCVDTVIWGLVSSN